MQSRIAVLVSGSGSNLQAIIDAINKNELDCQISLVVSSNTKAFALERAKKNNIPTIVISKKDYVNPSDEILKMAQQYKIDLIVLAGYLGILSGQILDIYNKKIINIHPSLLPKYGGNGMYGHFVHEAVIQNHEKKSGVTIHYVTDKVDSGNIILQVEVPVFQKDTPDSLAARILKQEHKILPKAIQKVLNNY